MIGLKFFRRLSLVLLLALAGHEANAQSCPAGMTSTGDGYCVGAGETYCGDGQMCSQNMACTKGGRCFYKDTCYPDQVHVGQSCLPAGSVVCDGGAYSCHPGERCVSGGRCGGGPPATGPMCGRDRARAGYACNPYNGYAYNPRTDKLCGTALCDVRDECGDNACLAPFCRTAATPQSAARRPQVKAPQVQAPTIRTPTVNVPAPPTVNTPAPPKVTTPSPTVNVPAPSTPAPPTVNAAPPQTTNPTVPNKSN